MPNANAPFGLRSLMRTLSGGEPQTRLLTKPASDTAPIYRNDPVYPIADNQIKGGRSTPGFLGVSLSFGKASALTEQIVIVSPDAVYEIQADAAGSGFAAASEGLNADITIPNPAGDSTTGVSKAMLSSASLNTTNTLDLAILGLNQVQGNDYGTNARIVVRFNRHHLALGRTGVA